MLRYVNAIIIALAITAGLFFGMRLLIQSGDASLEDAPRGPVLDFVRLKKEETVEKKKRKPKKPPKPEAPPPKMNQPQQMSSSELSPSANTMAFAADIDTSASLDSGLALQGGDGEYLPIVKVQPVYPRRALSRGIEGYVIVEFTVTELGTVKDPVVVEAQPADIFNRAAIDAARKFKYKPRVIDGKPAQVAGVQNKITFNMK